MGITLTSTNATTLRDEVDHVVCAGLLIERKSNGSNQSRCRNRAFFITSFWARCYGAKLKRLNSSGLDLHGLDVRFGSIAACQHHIKRTAASGTNPAIQQTNFQNPNLNVCFAQYRTFRLLENRCFKGPLSARSGHSHSARMNSEDKFIVRMYFRSSPAISAAAPWHSRDIHRVTI